MDLRNLARVVFLLSGLSLCAGPAFAAMSGPSGGLPGPAMSAPEPAAPASVAPKSAAPKPVAPAPSAPESGQIALTATDLGAWLDGFMPYAMARANVAGTVVVVVKDGQVLFEKGYGFADVKAQTPVDAKRTLFRPGSVSKLFTWTAVMQLVEAGKIDLDADINTYLDFKIPPAFGKPITMRDLMTHTPGFEETIKNLIVPGRKTIGPLHDVVAAWVPERIFPPGKVSAYSNYGAALAGYIVQRISGEPFPQYVARHILGPLGMTQATFAQPLPKRLAPDMSKGYMQANKPPKPFEMIGMSPAGGLSASGDAMARFMLAYLNGGTYNGARILSAQSIATMWANQHVIAPGLPAMGLGFYHMDRNGHVVVAHGGDTIMFHSDLILIPDAHVGIFFSQNSAGGEHGMLRGPLFDRFMDRYFPAPAAPHMPTLKSAKADAARIAGSYLVSRRSDSNFLRIGALMGQTRVSAGEDGIVTVSDIKDTAGTPLQWREVAPLRWQQVHGRHVLIAKEEGGQIVEIASDKIPPIMTLTRAPFWRSAVWSVPLLIATIAMLALTVLFWPIKAILRWRYERPFGLRGQAAWLYRGTRIVALIDLVFLGGWAAFLTMAGNNLGLLTAASDPLVHGLQLLGMLGTIGVVLPFWDFAASLPDGKRPWWTKATTLLVALACAATLWFGYSECLIGWGVNY